MKEKTNYKKKCAELEKRIKDLEEWYSSEIKRKDKRIEELEKQKALFTSSAMKEAEKRYEAQVLMDRMKDKLNKMQNILKDDKMKSK
jgi:uncharacterized coiled-coil protein SlyX